MDGGFLMPLYSISARNPQRRPVGTWAASRRVPTRGRRRIRGDLFSEAMALGGGTSDEDDGAGGLRDSASWLDGDREVLSGLEAGEAPGFEEGPAGRIDVENAGGHGLAFRKDPELVLLVRRQRREVGREEHPGLRLLAPEDLRPRGGLRVFSAEEEDLDVVALEHSHAQIAPRHFLLGGREL